ncbi:DUF6376 family protein [Cohnella sp.]|uniref:DUF6376 family protein n=1 Tax=Cohnella sp. TaxID=1883426 RepID=UPI003569C9DD
MRKLMLLLLMFASLMLSACSLLEKANSSLEYVNQATEHINNLSDFAEQAPRMIQDASLNSEAKQELENRLNSLKKDIEHFNLTKAPSVAKDIHQQLVEKNKLLLQEINQVVDNGHLSLDKIQNSQLLNTINDVTSLINRINSLGL